MLNTLINIIYEIICCSGIRSKYYNTPPTFYDIAINDNDLNSQNHIITDYNNFNLIQRNINIYDDEFSTYNIV